MGAILITPSPLSHRDVELLLSISGVDPSHAEDWWRASLGLPIAIMGRIRATRREVSGLPFDARELPSESRKILKALRTQKKLVVTDLARLVGMNEHLLLDHCEVLFAEGLAEAADEGASIRLSGAS